MAHSDKRDYNLYGLRIGIMPYLAKKVGIYVTLWFAHILLFVY